MVQGTLSLVSQPPTDLSFEIRDGGGVLHTVNATGTGATEQVVGFNVTTVGPHYVRVLGDGTDNVQMYNLTVNQTVGCGGICPPDDGFEPNDT